MEGVHVFSNPPGRKSLYPDIGIPCESQDKPSSSVSLYPQVHMDDIVEIPSQSNASEDKIECNGREEIVMRIPGAVVHLIDKKESVELGSGEFMLVRLVQGSNDIAMFARVEDQIQWPLAKDEAAVRVDHCHYFFSLRLPKEAYDSDDDAETTENVLNYGLTFAGEGQERALQELDKHLEHYSLFSVQNVSESLRVFGEKGSGNGRESEPSEARVTREKCAAYWITLAPNVEDYSGLVPRGIAAASGHIVKGILWCGDVTIDQLTWGHKYLQNRLEPNQNPTDISPEAMKRIRRAKRVSKMSEKVAVGVLSGVVKVAGFVTQSVVNSSAGKKFFSLLPGEIVLASLDAFGKVCDSVEVAGKNVLTTSSVVTTGLVNHKYGEQAAELTNQSLGAAGHVISTAWTISKLRNALNPKNSLKPATIAKTAAKAMKGAKKEKQSK